jgi:hypothetical protein
LKKIGLYRAVVQDRDKLEGLLRDDASGDRTEVLASFIAKSCVCINMRLGKTAP